MRYRKGYCGAGLVALIVVALTSLSPAAAASDAAIEELKEKIEVLQKEVSRIADASASTAREPKSIVHLAGYGDATYIDAENSDGSFGRVKFAPIFHYMYGDLFMLEAELEFDLTDDGETETNMEYMSVDVFINDYTTLVAGKFLSPLGQFRQNLHPSWINKLVMAPPGFGHDGAAPIADVGVQLRGGLPKFGKVRTNYAFYVSNGVELEAETEDGEIELEGIKAEGSTSNEDGEFVFGGRIGVIPIAKLEIGISGATGETSVTELDGEDSEDNGNRDYDVLGADFSWQHTKFDLRGEYIQQKVGDASTGVALEGGKWKTWYVQASHKLLPTKFEGVVRYTDFDTPHASKDQKQWAVGLNYLFANNVMAKASYEFNDGLSGAPADDNRFLLQLAYGF